jgi:hypothetical protein
MSVRCNISSAPVDCYKARPPAERNHLKDEGLKMTPASWKLASIGAALCFALAASPAGAQRADDMKGGGQHPCAGDAQSICSEFIPDRGKVASCLFKNKARLSAACSAALGGGGSKAKAHGKKKGKGKKSKKSKKHKRHH